MKSCEEITKAVLDRRDECLAVRRKRIKTAQRVAGSLCCITAVLILGIGVWKSGFFSLDPGVIIDESDTQATQNTTELPTQEPTFDDNPLPHGGDRGGYTYAFVHKLHGVSGELMDLVKETRGIDTHDWFMAKDAENKSLKYRGDEPGRTPLLINFIRDFEITREEFEQYNNEMIEFHLAHGWRYEIYETAFTQEEIDAIYSGDRTEWVRVMANEYAIVKNGEAYAADWYVFASAEELAEHSITVEEVDKAVEKLATLGTMGDYVEYYFKKRGYTKAQIDELISSQRKPSTEPVNQGAVYYFEYDEEELERYNVNYTEGFERIPLDYSGVQYREELWDDKKAAEYFGKDFAALENKSYMIEDVKKCPNSKHLVVYDLNGNIVYDNIGFNYIYYFDGGSKEVRICASKTMLPHHEKYILKEEKKTFEVADGTQVTFYITSSYYVADFELDGINVRVICTGYGLNSFEEFYKLVSGMIEDL